MAKDIFHTLLLMGLKTNHNATLFATLFQLKNDMLPFLFCVFFLLLEDFFYFKMIVT